MYNFKMRTNDKLVENIANSYFVTLILDNELLKAWKITDIPYFYEYELEKRENDYHLTCITEGWNCSFTLNGNMPIIEISIENGFYNGQHLKAASRLKIFDTITSYMWALKQAGKID